MNLRIEERKSEGLAPNRFLLAGGVILGVVGVALLFIGAAAYAAQKPGHLTFRVFKQYGKEVAILEMSVGSLLVVISGSLFVIRTRRGALRPFSKEEEARIHKSLEKQFQERGEFSLSLILEALPLLLQKMQATYAQEVARLKNKEFIEQLALKIEEVDFYEEMINPFEEVLSAFLHRVEKGGQKEAKQAVEHAKRVAEELTIDLTKKIREVISKLSLSRSYRESWDQFFKKYERFKLSI